jgi:Holliday junction resolvase RusA-like endonuclease
MMTSHCEKIQLKRQYFVVMGEPKPQGRPRSCVRGNHASAYEDKKDREDKMNIRAQIVTQHPTLIGPGQPVALSLEYYLPRPKVHFDVKGNIKPRFMDAPHVSRPDCDNLEKKIKDSLSGIVWYDDCQVVRVEHEKAYCLPGEAPHTKIAVITW